jgi:hypothetical protein
MGKNNGEWIAFDRGPHPFGSLERVLTHIQNNSLNLEKSKFLKVKYKLWTFHCRI